MRVVQALFIVNAFEDLNHRVEINKKTINKQSETDDFHERIIYFFKCFLTFCRNGPE